MVASQPRPEAGAPPGPSFPGTRGGRPLLLLAQGSSRLGRGRLSSQLVEAVRLALRTRGEPELDVVSTVSPDGARRSIREALATGCRIVVVAGGDGAVRVAAHELARSPASLALVPAGTGNQLATSLGLPRDPLACARAIAHLRPRVIDLGLIHGVTGAQAFAVACGAGFDARVMAAASPALKARLGVAAYLVALVSEARRWSTFELGLEIDGQALETRASTVLVANAGQPWPGLVDLRRPIRPDDGLLEVFVMRAGSPLSALLALGEVVTRRDLDLAGRGRALRGYARRVLVDLDPPQPLELDGDLVSEPPGALSASFSAEVQPAALQVLAP